jgi:hypothetical protein
VTSGVFLVASPDPLWGQFTFAVIRRNGLLALFVATVLPGFLIGIKLDNELGAIIIIAYLFLGYLGFYLP